MPQRPEPAPVALNNILASAARLAAKPALEDQVAVIVKSATWLGSQPAAADPALYRLQLTVDDYLLTYALGHASQMAAIVGAVGQDLAIKQLDCELMGHPRLVPVEIHTVKAGSESGGWRVLYQWVPPTTAFETAEMSFPEPSSPTRAKVPPGVYRMRAEKGDGKGGNVQSDAVSVPVGGGDGIVWRILVPYP